MSNKHGPWEPTTSTTSKVLLSNIHTSNIKTSKRKKCQDDGITYFYSDRP